MMPRLAQNIYQELQHALYCSKITVLRWAIKTLIFKFPIIHRVAKNSTTKSHGFSHILRTKSAIRPTENMFFIFNCILTVTGVKLPRPLMF